MIAILLQKHVDTLIILSTSDVNLHRYEYMKRLWQEFFAHGKIPANNFFYLKYQYIKSF